MDFKSLILPYLREKRYKIVEETQHFIRVRYQMAYFNVMIPENPEDNFFMVALPCVETGIQDILPALIAASIINERTRVTKLYLDSDRDMCISYEFFAYSPEQLYDEIDTSFRALMSARREYFKCVATVRDNAENIAEDDEDNSSEGDDSGNDGDESGEDNV